METSTDLVIVGAGAAGLMAGACAGTAGLRAVVLERRHRPGLKLLMCGNNRCNISHQGSAGDLLRAYGSPVSEFLADAVARFSPRELVAWFTARGLPTVVHADGRIFPRSANADDVLHCLTDHLRDFGVPLALNCPVDGIERNDDGFVVRSESLNLTCRRVLLATGGVSYPKTGSVGDGQRFARALGHRVTPYRAGLAGIEFAEPWLHPARDISLPEVQVTLFAGGKAAGETTGELLLSRQCARGPAMVNASRIMARGDLREVSFVIDLFPGLSLSALATALAQARERGRGSLAKAVAAAGLLPADLAAPLLQGLGSTVPASGDDMAALAGALKQWNVVPRRVRPLKEAMVTVGGVFLDEIDPRTMESRLCPGLYFAGEVMDVDGPTGGYNLHAAFATAHLAAASAARELPASGSRPSRAPSPGGSSGDSSGGSSGRSRPRRGRHGGSRRRSAG